MKLMASSAIALVSSVGLVAAFSAFADGPATSGLSLWLESNEGLASDGSSWMDQSGNGHDATALPIKILP